MYEISHVNKRKVMAHLKESIYELTAALDYTGRDVLQYSKTCTLRAEIHLENVLDILHKVKGEKSHVHKPSKKNS